MDTYPLFTIGHSTRNITDFTALLVENRVTAVADVRSSPYSRHFPHFNMDALKDALRRCQIQYVFLGEELGARRAEPECYINDVARYELIAKTQAFESGLNRLRRGMQSHRIALMCAEKDPLTCHRTILVCRQLRKECSISHIIDHGVVEDHAAAETRLLRLTGLPDRALFDDRQEYLEEAYEKLGNEIAYRRGLLKSVNPREGE
jgi:uncharacterized protein (DUF488 family)